MTSSRSTKSGALLLFAFVIVAWGLNWTVTKLIVTQVTPLWTTAIRTGIGALALLAMLAASKQFRIPKRGDVPVVLANSFPEPSEIAAPRRILGFRIEAE